MFYLLTPFYWIRGDVECSLIFCSFLQLFVGWLPTRAWFAQSGTLQVVPRPMYLRAVATPVPESKSNPIQSKTGMCHLCLTISPPLLFASAASGQFSHEITRYFTDLKDNDYCQASFIVRVKTLNMPRLPRHSLQAFSTKSWWQDKQWAYSINHFDHCSYLCFRVKSCSTKYLTVFQMVE